MLLSFVVTAIPCLIIDKIIGENMEKLSGDRCFAYHRRDRDADCRLRFRQRIRPRTPSKRNSQTSDRDWTFQILAAAFPGTSRSMATIIGGQLFGLARPVALEFSFFLAIPVMLAASAFKLYSLFC